MEISLSFLGDLAYSIPAVFFVYFFREWVKNKVFEVTEGKEREKVLSTIDLVALFSAFFSLVGWGSFLRYRNKENFLSYFSAQLSLLFLIVLAILYAQLKGIASGGYTHYLLKTIITTSWVSFLANWIPLPPFDASYLYLKALLEIRSFVFFLWGYKIFFAITLILFFKLPLPLQGKFLLDWAGLI